MTFSTAEVIGTDVTYIWTGVTATGITELTTIVPNFTLDPTTVSNAGTYTVTVRGGLCDSPASNEVTLTIKPRPDAPELTVDKDVHCEGERLEFMATPISGATYDWTFTNPAGRVDPLATTTRPSLVIENLVFTNTGTYQVTITLDGCSSLPSNDVAIDVASGGLPDATASSPAMPSVGTSIVPSVPLATVAPLTSKTE